MWIWEYRVDHGEKNIHSTKFYWAIYRVLKAQTQKVLIRFPFLLKVVEIDGSPSRSVKNVETNIGVNPRRFVKMPERNRDYFNSEMEIAFPFTASIIKRTLDGIDKDTNRRTVKIKAEIKNRKGHIQSKDSNVGVHIECSYNCNAWKLKILFENDDI